MRALAFLIVLLMPAAALAETTPRTAIPEPQSFVTQHRGTFGGERIDYTAEAFETHLKDDKGNPTASIFAIAYTRRDVRDPRTRPITFVFNGGPGSASLWLHMGQFGPKRINVPSDGTDSGAPPYEIIDNPHSILDVSDLVFIDPVGTGYSRALGDTDPKDFWGVEEDAKSLTEFVRLYLTRNQRWNSPRYLAGESYGTTRAAAMAREMTRGFQGMDLNGVLLISSILDFQTARFRPGNDSPYVAFLPTMAATAWYHGKIEPRPESLEAFLDEVREFALNDYTVALARGSRLSEAEFADIATRLAHYTGLSRRYVEGANLRVSAFRFMKELLREEGRVVGRFDSRYTGRDYDDVGETFEADPSAYGITGAYVAAVNDHLARVLNVRIDREYKVLSREPGRNWNWDTEEGRGWPAYVNVAPWLGAAMRQNPDFRTFVGNGYYDMATPFFGTENTMASNGIPGERVVMAYYPAGHMMYTHEPSLEAMANDIRAFIRGE
jgi:carboxypeptidase C (cathepsin A)